MSSTTLKIRKLPPPTQLQTTTFHKKIIPLFNGKNHKGSHGRILTVGGSDNFVGAPLYSATSALRAGSDLSSVFTYDSSCGLAMKSQGGGELMITIIDEEEKERKFIYDEYGCTTNNELPSNLPSLSNIHCLCLGPGLGRNEYAHNLSNAILFNIKEGGEEKDGRSSVPVVIDADGLWLFGNSEAVKQQRDDVDLLPPHPLSFISSYSKCIITPNYMEFTRLYKYYELPDNQTTENMVGYLLKELKIGGIVLKGEVDIIAVFGDNYEDDEIILRTCNIPGSQKRCGGLGDILSGVTGTFVGWWYMNEKNPKDYANEDEHELNLSDALYHACAITRNASKHAFDLKKRAMKAEDVIGFIGEEIEKTFPAGYLG